MITMKPIEEPDVLDTLNCGRYHGDVRGYVVMDGPEQYLGSLLYTVTDGVTTVQECNIDDNAVVDGGVRACVAAGEKSGATMFSVNDRSENLAKWLSVFGGGAVMPQPNEKLFHSCK
ncbi:MAG: hypothetical protein RSC00_00680 [Ruthenibacterium sp.]